MHTPRALKFTLGLLAGAALICAAPSARADLVLSGGSIASSFTDLGAQGFGNDPRLLTMQTNTIETGSVAPNGSGGVVLSGDAISGSNKANAPTLGFLGWTTGSQVGIGFNSDQTGATGITMQSLLLTLYSGTNAVQTFALASALTPLNFSSTDLALQQGNGNAVFLFILNATEQAQFNADLLLHPYSSFSIGLASSLGCAGTPSATCQVSNDGPDSFLALAQPGSPALVPLPPAALLFGTALVGMGILGRRRRKNA